jgi:hypothetical protein
MADQVGTTADTVRLSYKFQRLRERLRDAVRGGELTGKLPGERALAKRFNVNAKTLSKALTDLAAEGLLERTIGRGTFVRGSQPSASKAGRWLILCDPGAEKSELVTRLVGENENTQVSCEVGGVRPSYINQFTAVIDMARNTPDSFLRDLVVRNIPVVAVGHEPRTYSMHSVVLDQQLALTAVARELLLEGHRRLCAVEERGSTMVAEALRKTGARYGADVAVDACLPEEIASLAESEATALVCDSPASARAVVDALTQQGVNIPARFSVAAVGTGEAACSGYYASPAQVVESVLQLLRDPQARRPVTLWLVGTFVNKGTTGPIAGNNGEVRPEVRVAGMAV